MESLNKNILLTGELVAKKWKVAEKIGEGTFSQIYSAYDAERVQDKVAIKVEAPSSLKPVLEWESTILKSLQNCPHVCRYYYHGKHAESTVLVMELLGESMSMLRVSPDSIHGVPIGKCVAVGLEMLDCIEAFHRHGYVHRDIKASNFALSVAAKTGMSATHHGASSQGRYLLIDFGLSRQHISDGKAIPARTSAEFRGTSMYASLSAHRRQELGPKDDLWSWFYLVLDFMRGELPWATDAQQKNRDIVFRLKEYYTDSHPALLVEDLDGANQLLKIIKYLGTLQYEDTPDYNLLRNRLRRVVDGSSHEDTMELWDSHSSDRERALEWAQRTRHALQKGEAADRSILELLLAVANKYSTFFVCEGLASEEHADVQEVVYQLETRLNDSAPKFAPPQIQSFVRRRISAERNRTDALRKRRERDQQIRSTIVREARRQSSTASADGGVAATTRRSDSPLVSDVDSTGGRWGTTPTITAGDPVHKSDSSMEVSDDDDARVVKNVDVKSSSTSTLPPRGPPSRWPLKMETSSSRGNLLPPPPGPAFPPRGAMRGPPPPMPPPHMQQQQQQQRIVRPGRNINDANGSGGREMRQSPLTRHDSGNGFGWNSREITRDQGRVASASRSRSRSRSYSRSPSRSWSRSPCRSRGRERRGRRSSPSRSRSRSRSFSRSRSRSSSPPRARHYSRDSRGRGRERSRSRSRSRSPSRSPVYSSSHSSNHRQYNRGSGAAEPALAKPVGNGSSPGYVNRVYSRERSPRRPPSDMRTAPRPSGRDRKRTRWAPR